MNVEQNQLIETLYRIGAVQFGEFKLKSGRRSPFYINLRKIISFPQLLKDIAQIYADHAKPLSYDLICGVPYTALPIATMMSTSNLQPMVMRRKEKKTYGEGLSIEGVFHVNQSCLVIEDVVTTGASIIETIHDLHYAGLIVKDVIALIDRQEEKHPHFQTFNCHAIFSLREVFQTLLARDCLTDGERNIVSLLVDQRCAL